MTTLSTVSCVQLIHEGNELMAVVYNGQSNPMVVTISNKGQNNYTIVGSSSSFHDPVKHWKLLKNGTTTKHKQALNAGENFTVPYNVYSE